jgi:hypothetical protein
MRLIGTSRTRILAATIAAVAAAGIGVAAAGTSAKTPSNGISKGHGINEFGMTKSYFDGHTVSFTYDKGFFCDKSISSHATTGCEAGVDAKKLPPGAKSVDPLYITVPIGTGAAVSPMKMECPTGPVCVDHPGTIDLSRLESTIHTIAPYSGLSNAKLTAALKNYATPGHSHFITTKNGGKAEWWDVKVVAVTSTAEFNKLNAHGSVKYLLAQIKAGKAVGPVPTNLFLYFSVQ